MLAAGVCLSSFFLLLFIYPLRGQLADVFVEISPEGYFSFVPTISTRFFPFSCLFLSRSCFNNMDGFMKSYDWIRRRERTMTALDIPSLNERTLLPPLHSYMGGILFFDHLAASHQETGRWSV
jgi:hypothetical protein